MSIKVPIKYLNQRRWNILRTAIALELKGTGVSLSVKEVGDSIELTRIKESNKKAET